MSILQQLNLQAHNLTQLIQLEHALEYKPLSNAGMSSVLKRMNVTDATVHGFRSTFRDYIGEETQFNPVIAEHCLAHSVGDATERAYARGDMLAKRFDMVNIWADYVTSGLTNGSSTATRV